MLSGCPLHGLLRPNLPCASRSGQDCTQHQRRSQACGHLPFIPHGIPYRDVSPHVYTIYCIRYLWTVRMRNARAEVTFCFIWRASLGHCTPLDPTNPESKQKLGKNSRKLRCASQPPMSNPFFIPHVHNPTGAKLLDPFRALGFFSWTSVPRRMQQPQRLWYTAAASACRCWDQQTQSLSIQGWASKNNKGQETYCWQQNNHPLPGVQAN